MFLKNYHHFENKETTMLMVIILFSFLIRIPVILIYGDTSLENEWKIIVENLVEHEILAFRNFDGYLLPNLYMPPLYPIYLYLFSFFDLSENNYVFLILLSQAFLSSVSVIIFYKINRFFFSQKISFYSSVLFSIIPLHLYACSQISSASIQSFLLVLFFYCFFLYTRNKIFLTAFIFSIVSALLILLRGEFTIFYLFSILFLFLFFKVSIKKIFLILLITTITISPYLVRNFILFEKIAITKSLGFNLWKGNNPNSLVQGSEISNPELKEKIDSIPRDKFYEFNFDKIYLDEAINNINEQPKKYLILFFEKILSFLFIDIKSTQINYYHPLHYLPVLFLGITSIIGIIVSDKKSKELNYLIIFFAANIIIFSIFFILPRYKMATLPLQIIFTNILIDYINKKFLKIKNKKDSSETNR
tara:strand:- start:340 stop:1593 length:1254 start_codon:yes stop_codon:yes gene_type:complete